DVENPDLSWGGEKKRGWYLGVDIVLMLVSRIISEYKFISLSREPDRYHSGTGYCEEPRIIQSPLREERVPNLRDGTHSIEKTSVE
ncbi:MAG: hypothetical protein H8E82_04480, partial [Candidatus Marinimicrobia bacterium]|nr:hypothetical protein [Candidatus Neomarinimicrobiota bacterium]